MIIVATATAKEMKSAFASAPAVKQGEAVEFELNGHTLLLTVTGVGLINAAMVAGRLLDRPGVTGMVNLGIAGAYSVGAYPLGTACYVWQEDWPEFGLLDEEGSVDAKGLGLSLGHVGKKEIWNRILLNPVNDAEKMGLFLPDSCLRTSSVSVSSVTGTEERAAWLKTSCNGDLENMEGFALAFGAAQKGVPFLEVRTVSNLVGSREKEDWDLNGALGKLGDIVAEIFKG
jgi:futalosine hydrolase